MYIYSEANKYRRYFRLFQFDLLGGRSAHEQTSEYTVLSRFSWKLAQKPTRYCIAVYFPRHSHFPIHVNKSNYYVLSHRARRAFQPLVDIFTILYTVAEHMSIESTRFPIHSFPCMHFGAETLDNFYWFWYCCGEYRFHSDFHPSFMAPSDMFV